MGRHANYPGMPVTLRTNVKDAARLPTTEPNPKSQPNPNPSHRIKLGGHSQVAALERAKAALQAQAAELQAEAGAAGAGQAALAAELHERLLARLLAAVCGLVMCVPGQALCRRVPSLLAIVLRTIRESASAQCLRVSGRYLLKGPLYLHMGVCQEVYQVRACTFCWYLARAFHAPQV